MKNWQKTRNYRRMKGENNNVIANVITVFGEKIEVSDELFTMYAHMDAHERYIMEEAPRGRVFSLDKMAEDGIDLGSHHKKLRRLFIDNKILEKDRQKAIVGEQDGHIIFLYAAGRLYLKKRPENAILYGTVVIYKNF